MPVTCTTYRYNAETGRDEAQETKVIYEGAVLASGYGRHHVCSDNAMIDSGEYLWAEVWAGDRIEKHEWYMGRGGISASATVDADQETQDKAAAYRKAVKLVGKIQDAFKDAARQNADNRKVRTAGRVEVFKGRKVPKGIYFVRSMGEGDYGPYVHLSTTPKPEIGNKVYNYVNPDNCRVVDAETVDAPYNETVRMLASAVIDYTKYDRQVNVDAFAPLHDALVEDGKDADAAELDAYLFLVLAVAV